MTGHAPPSPSAPTARRRTRLRTRLLTLGVALIVVLAIAEIAVRPFTPMEIVGPSAVMHDPVYRRVLIPGYRGTVHNPGVSYRLSVNSLGFRGPEPTGPLEGCVLFLGDSYTLGDCVDDGNEYAQLIARRLSGEMGSTALQVINAGLAGEGQGRWLKILDRRAPEWDPSCVVLQLCANDFRDNQVDKVFSLGADGSLIENPVPPESLPRRVQRHVERIPLLGYSRLYCFVKRRIGMLTHKPTPTDIPADTATETSDFDDLTIAMVRSAIERCERKGWPVVGITAQLGPGPRLDRVRAEFDRIGASVIIVPTKADRPDLHHTTDDHWNSAGHALAADLLGPQIDRALATRVPSEPAP